jgi:8-oxo-dGTP pyrophosphatase MutT (NUDIX family)
MPDPATDPLADRQESWPVRSSRDLHRDAWVMALRSDRISRPGHDDAFDRLVLEHPGAVVVLAVDDEERALVLAQYRHPVRRRLVELPAGLRDDDVAEPLSTARRELLEEAGLQAGRWEHLLTTHPSPGISSELIEIFLARDLTPADRGGFEATHEEADMTLRWVDVDELVSAVLDGRVTDGPLGLAVLAYAHRRARRTDPTARR